jgi:methionyl aminopeptidase
MEKEELKNYEKAQSISDSAAIYARALVKEGARIIEIAEKVEGKIVQLGGKIAFPLNISINDVAAHYTPDINDGTVLKAGDLVKIDLGVHVDGYIWDKAFTVCIGQSTHPLIEASEKALAEAFKVIKAGAKVFEISEVVESAIEEFKFNPIRNLCGHGLQQYNTHTHPTIPNGRNSIKDEIEAGSVIAMEVFTTNGMGWVKESDKSLIFGFVQEKPVRLWEARQILQRAAVEFETLPFAKRWLAAKMSELKIDMALRQLLDVDAIRQYPVLREENGGLVAQTEDSVIVK